MLNKFKLFKPITPFPLFFSSSSSSSKSKPKSLSFFLISTLKSSSSLSSLQQIHALSLKLALHHSNTFLLNSLLHHYSSTHNLLLPSALLLFSSSPPSALDTASFNILLSGASKSGRIDLARHMFDKIPQPDTISFTTLIQSLSQHSLPDESLALFRAMLARNVRPNEVTFAAVLSSCCALCGCEQGRRYDFSIRSQAGTAVHALVIKVGLDGFVLVGTNLVHWYVMVSGLEIAKKMFDGMPERNTVTWNVMLNGFAKAGIISLARELFECIPVKDLVSWSTMIDGYLKVDMMDEALFMYCEMLREDPDVRPNEVMLVDLISACSRRAAMREGLQLHSLVLKAGLDSNSFVQSAIIHLYAECGQIELACMNFRLVRKASISCWNALLSGFIKNGMVDEARRLFDEMPERDVVSWTSLISGYLHFNRSDLALGLFGDMINYGAKPNAITLATVLPAVASSGTVEQGEWIHQYVINNENSIPLTDNLIAALIDMYAKLGSFDNALKVFANHQNPLSSNISPWNALICGLAMHGHVETCLQVFSDLQKCNVKPNGITFLGVLAACCHAGLVDIGKRHFELMRSVYEIEPSIKHYGCMVDLLGRAGCFEEAEKVIDGMPMVADVIIWGSLLAAAWTHGNMEVGERAAERLAKLDPKHGGGRVLLSNLYADSRRWDDVVVVRREMQDERLKKEPGCSGIL